MNRQISHFLLLGLQLCLGGGLLLAQTDESVQGSLRAISWSERSLTFLVGTDAEDHSELTITPYAASGPVDFSLDNANADLIFTQAVPGQDSPVEIARLKRPAAIGERLLAVFFSKSDGSFEVFAVPDFDERSGVATFQFINFTQDRLGVLFAKERFVLDPLGTQRIHLTDNDEDAAIEIQLYGSRSDELARLYSNLWSYRSDVRTLVMIAPLPENPGRIAVRRLRERILE